MMIELPVLDEAPADVSPQAGRLLRLLADPTRRRIFLALMRGETCNCELAGALGLAQNLVSHHVRQLREAGLVRERRDTADARWIYYRLDADALTACWQSLDALLNPARLRDRTPVCPPYEAQR